MNIVFYIIHLKLYLDVNKASTNWSLRNKLCILLFNDICVIFKQKFFSSKEYHKNI